MDLGYNPHSAPWGVTQHNYPEKSILKVINYTLKAFFIRLYTVAKYNL
jgi:hypothetical protein